MSILRQFINFKMFNKCNFPYKWVESRLGCLKIVMFTKLANYLQCVEVINFKITIDARHALLDSAAHHPGTGSTECILLVIWSQLGDIIGSLSTNKLVHHIINVLINNPVNKIHISLLSNRYYQPQNGPDNHEFYSFDKQQLFHCGASG